MNDIDIYNDNKCLNLNSEQLKTTTLINLKVNEFIQQYAKNINDLSIIIEYFNYASDTVEDTIHHLSDELITSKIKEYYTTNNSLYPIVNNLTIETIKNSGHQYIYSLQGISVFEKDVLYEQIKNIIFENDILIKIMKLIGYHEDQQEVYYMSKRCPGIFKVQYCLPALINKEYSNQYIKLLQSIEDLL